jgi:hypothetical protein
VVAYRWHPLHGERLRLYQRTRRDGREILYVEVGAGVSREVPAWMCDAAACGAISVGPPEIGIGTLNELRAVLTAHLPDSARRRTSDLSREEEVPGGEPTTHATPLPLDRTENVPPMTPAPAEAELVQALADLLLEAFGAAVTTTPNTRSARDESEDHA